MSKNPKKNSFENGCERVCLYCGRPEHQAMEEVKRDWTIDPQGVAFRLYPLTGSETGIPALVGNRKQEKNFVILWTNDIDGKKVSVAPPILLPEVVTSESEVPGEGELLTHFGPEGALVLIRLQDEVSGRIYSGKIEIEKGEILGRINSRGNGERLSLLVRLEEFGRILFDGFNFEAWGLGHVIRWDTENQPRSRRVARILTEKAKK